MHCHVYASRRKSETYLWLRDPALLETLPEALRQVLGELRFVLEVELDSARRLPHQDTEQVLSHLLEQGWHLQLPPGEKA
ncbi:YcgL domain-containing protein [Oleiagrimonas soli]|uniref:Membrane protein n=1 Tax=Oleiagrimonas soli TaxID=1543381 RepID=A0A099CS30_9GAMM|nr:YcgL domain-containing protein [Oleiagrimonas soli]KGI76818.1 membrane protein [Oleiagrimonas soli]MBB6185090.1 hypothetical protein [Oleiagrimonas soli]